MVAAFGNSAQAEDVTQEAFLQLYRCLHAGQSIGNARAWVFRVAHNLAVNQIKSQQFITPLDDETWAEVQRVYQDSSPTLEQKLIQQEKFDRLRIAVISDRAGETVPALENKGISLSRDCQDSRHGHDYRGGNTLPRD